MKFYILYSIRPHGSLCLSRFCLLYSSLYFHFTLEMATSATCPRIRHIALTGRPGKYFIYHMINLCHILTLCSSVNTFRERGGVMWHQHRFSCLVRILYICLNYFPLTISSLYFFLILNIGIWSFFFLFLFCLFVWFFFVFCYWLQIRFYSNLEDTDIINTNMSYGATVGASAANSNLI